MSETPPPAIDVHNHLVPGVDDGAKDVEAVIDSVRRMVDVGIRRIVTTPHIRGSLTLDPEALEGRLSEISSAFEQARAAIAEHHPDVEFRRGQEVLVDVPRVDYSDARLRLAGTSFVLIEWPRLQLPRGTTTVIEDVRHQGYRPIVAHPERYSGMAKSFSLVGRWREAGGYLQVNYGSLVGRYGSDAQALAYRLLRNGWVDYLASDFHGHASLKIYKREACEALHSRGAADTFERLAHTNPGRILADQEPLFVPSLDADPSLMGRLRGMIRGESG